MGQGAITDTTTHNFVSATTGAVITGGNYAHTFVLASTDGITKGGDSIALAEESLIFTCDYNSDGNTTQKKYPRSSGSNYPGGADPAYNTSVPIQNVGTTSHTVTTASYVPTTGILTLTVPNHGFTSSTNHTATGATFATGSSVLRLTVAAHGFRNGDRIKLVDNSLTFTCALDSNASNHTYPRATDPISNKWLTISNVSTNWFEVNVGNYPFGQTPISNSSAHVFVSATTNGIVKANDAIKLDKGSITFTCAKDNNATDHAYPRLTDPSYFEWL